MEDIISLPLRKAKTNQQQQYDNSYQNMIARHVRTICRK